MTGNCSPCGARASRCPCHPDPPALTRHSLDEYMAFMRERVLALTF